MLHPFLTPPFSGVLSRSHQVWSNLQFLCKNMSMSLVSSNDRSPVLSVDVIFLPEASLWWKPANSLYLSGNAEHYSLLSPLQLRKLDWEPWLQGHRFWEWDGADHAHDLLSYSQKIQSVLTFCALTKSDLDCIPSLVVVLFARKSVVSFCDLFGTSKCP